MIISNSLIPTFEEFNTLVRNTSDALNYDAKNRPHYYQGRDGRKLETDVRAAMDIVAKGTRFEGTIVLIGGQKFPDIVAKRYYGVEVKTSTQNHWVTTGNSVFESTRVEDVEHIFCCLGS